jgi:hypothetical protein
MTEPLRELIADTVMIGVAKKHSSIKIADAILTLLPKHTPSDKMMIYVVSFYNDGGSGDPECAFSTRELAERYVESRNKTEKYHDAWKTWYVTELLVDAVVVKEPK